MPALPIDCETRRRLIALHVDGSRRRRFSLVSARRSWYATYRQTRYARYVAGLSQ